jgi:hypothetical protein
MADNIAVSNPASATTYPVATDEVTGTLEHVQLMKLAISTDGSRSLIPATTNGLQVIDAARAAATIATALSTELNSLANNAASAASAAIDAATLGYTRVDLELAVTFAVAPTAGTYLDIYCLPTLDGTNYADGGVGVVPNDALRIARCSVRAVATAQRLVAFGAAIPPLSVKLLVYNNATGQALTASGHTLKYRLR